MYLVHCYFVEACQKKAFLCTLKYVYLKKICMLNLKIFENSGNNSIRLVLL